MLLDADVEPHGAVEGRALCDQHIGEVIAEGRRVFFCGKVLLLAAPARDCVDDAADELADARLAALRAQGAAEVLLNDDVGRHL